MSVAGFGTLFCQKESYDSIYVGQRHESHYQGLSLEEFERIVRPYIADRRVVCYGSSLGAYTAPYFGGIMDADILAGAPMLPSWPGLRKPRYKDFVLCHLPLTDAPRSSVQPTVLHDPLIPSDTKILNETVRLAYPDPVFVEYPFAGHTVLRTLNTAGVLRDVVLGYFESGVVPDVRLPTDGFMPYHLHYPCSAMRSSDPAEAVKPARRAFALETTSTAVSLLIRGLSRLVDKWSLLHLVDHELTAKEREAYAIRVVSLRGLAEDARR